MANEKTTAGHVITNPPRAVQVRVNLEQDENAPLSPHDAVVANVTILTDNRAQTDAVLSNWQEIAEATDAAIHKVMLRLGL